MKNKDKLKHANLKVTTARVAILRLLTRINKPVDITSVIEHLQMQHVQTDPATVFRVMNVFTEKGITRQVQLNEGKFRYELSNQPDHHHIVCVRCKKIMDVSSCGVSSLEKEIKSKTGYIIKSHTLEFFGVCPPCSLRLSEIGEASNTCQQ